MHRTWPEFKYDSQNCQVILSFSSSTISEPNSCIKNFLHCIPLMPPIKRMPQEEDFVILLEEGGRNLGSVQQYNPVNDSICVQLLPWRQEQKIIGEKHNGSVQMRTLLMTFNKRIYCMSDPQSLLQRTSNAKTWFWPLWIEKWLRESVKSCMQSIKQPHCDIDREMH